MQDRSVLHGDAPGSSIVLPRKHTAHFMANRCECPSGNDYRPLSEARLLDSRGNFHIIHFSINALPPLLSSGPLSYTLVLEIGYPIRGQMNGPGCATDNCLSRKLGQAIQESQSLPVNQRTEDCFYTFPPSPTHTCLLS